MIEVILQRIILIIIIIIIIIIIVIIRRRRTHFNIEVKWYWPQNRVLRNTKCHLNLLRGLVVYLDELFPAIQVGNNQSEVGLEKS